MQTKSFIRTLLFTGAISIISTVISAKDIYVSPKGSDTNPGTKEAPFATILKAKHEVRKLIKSGIDEDISVFLAGGTYTINETLVFGLNDSPENNNKVIWQAVMGEEPILSSGIKIQGWEKATTFPEYTPEAAKGNIWVADLPENLGCFRTMFDGEKMLPRAKSKSWSPPSPPESIPQSDSRNVHLNKDRYALRMIKYPGNMLREWENISDIECIFNPVPWNMMLIQLESVDVTNKVGWLAFEPNSQEGTKEHGAFVYIENAIDYLDEPGEWCVNTLTRKVYYWPEDGKPSNNIQAPALMELVKVEGKIRYDLDTDIPVKNIHFKGITFTKGDRSVWYKNHKGWGIQHDWDSFDSGNAMLRFRGAENCSVDECRFTSSGGSGIRLDLHAQNISVTNSYIDHVGHMGILLAGYGPGTKDVNKNNLIHNNIIHHCGEVIWHGHGIFLWQSGNNKITNNWIHDVPRKAIGVAGVRCQILMKPWSDFDEASRTIRWHEIEATVDSSLNAQNRYWPYLHARENLIKDNKATRTMLKLSDGASINVSGAGVNNRVEHNFLFDLLYTGFRTDDWQDETVTTNNLVWNCGGPAFIFKGHNKLINNIAVNTSKAIHLRAYPQQYFKPGAEAKNNIVVSDRPTSVIYVPAGWPKSMNLARPGNKKMPYEFDFDYNVYWQQGAKEFLALQQKEGIEQHTVVADPLFYDVEKGDFRLKKRSPALKLGFVPFDTNPESFGITSEYPEHFRQLDKIAVQKIDLEAYSGILNKKIGNHKDAK